MQKNFILDILPGSKYASDCATDTTDANGVCAESSWISSR